MVAIGLRLCFRATTIASSNNFLVFRRRLLLSPLCLDALVSERVTELREALGAGVTVVTLELVSLTDDGFGAEI